MVVRLLGLENQVQEHEERLKQHDKEIGRLNDGMLAMQKAMNEGLARVDESNRFLREQNTRQSEQNQEILSAVLNRNDDSDKRQHELKMLNRSNLWKMIFGIGGSAGVAFAFVLELLKYLGGR